MRHPLRLLLVPTALALVSTALAGPAAARPPQPQYPEPPAVEYTLDESRLPFAALPGTTTTRSWGELDGAGYQIEVPANWNGDVVMWAHGYRGTGTELVVDPPPAGLRQHLVTTGYAWAASSYTENGYDVDSGVESTHELLRFFERTVGKADRRYIAGASMGGHVTGVTIERYRAEYDGALPVCGVMGDRRLFDTFLDYNALAQALTDTPPVYPAPADYVTTTAAQMKTELGTPYPARLTEAGQDLRAATEQRTGGERPLFEAGFASFADFLFTVYPVFPGLGEEPGAVGGNADTVYQLDADPQLTAEEQALNAEVLRVEAARSHRGLDGVPTIDGRFRIPVLTMHGLGDLYVPFSMEQEYARDAAARGNSDLLVQRAVRAVGHCDFSAQEYQQAFTDLVRWVEQGVRPAGDDVLTPATVADRRYGCRFTVPQRAYDTERC